MSVPLRSHVSVRSTYFHELCADAEPHIENYELADFRVLWRMADDRALTWRRRANRVWNPATKQWEQRR